MNRLTILKILTIACLSIVLLLYGIRTIKEGLEIPTTTERSEIMFVTKQNSAVKHGLSPIDAPDRANTQTATFALG
jgi:hypothetical protein